VGDDMVPYMWIFYFLLLVCVIIMLYNIKTKNTAHPLNYCFWALVYVFACAIVMVVLCGEQSSYRLFLSGISRWRLDDRPVPVFVGEFGTGPIYSPGDINSNREWNNILRLLDEKSLDFAYWTLNGAQYKEGAWNEEGFGLLDMTMHWIRNETFTRLVFGSPSL
jgi:hypothetical protein